MARDLTTDVLRSDEPIRESLTEDGLYPEAHSRDLTLATHRIRNAWTFWSPHYHQAEKDVSFAYGDQWDREARAERESQQRPVLELNHLPQFIHQVTGAARQSKFSIKVMRAGGVDTGKSNPETGVYAASDLVAGIIRDIERRCNAPRRYCRAGQHSVESGIGWLMVNTTRRPDNPFSLELEIENIKNRWSVMMDPWGLKDDFEDALWCMRYSTMSRGEFRAHFPDATEGTGYPYESGTMGGEGFWGQAQSDNVIVSDYWWKEPVKRKAVQLAMPDSQFQEPVVLYEDTSKDILDDLIDAGWTRIKSREVNGFRVKYMRHVATAILDGPHDWPSNYLPIVPVFGRHINARDHTDFVGLVRYAKDAQRMMNYSATAAAERTGMSPKAPWLVGKSQIAGQEQRWREESSKPEGVLVFDDEHNPNMPQRQPGGTLATAELELLRSLRWLLNDTLGVHDSNLGKRSNETSGIAIARRQEQGDVSTYEFTDNLRQAIERVGMILVDMIPRIYTADTMRRILRSDGSEAMVEVNHWVTDEATGKQFIINALALSRYNVECTAGPATTTQREEFVRLMMEWARSMPQSINGVLDIVMRNLDMPEASLMADRLRAMIPPQMLTPEEREGMPEQPPTPEQQLEQQKLMTEQQLAAMKVEEAKISLEEAKTKLEAVRAQSQLKTEKAVQDNEADTSDGAGSDASGPDDIRKIVEQAVAEALAGRPGKR